MLERDSPDIRREAALSLGRTRNKDAVSPLLRALEGDEDPQVRWRAAMALEWIGFPGVIPTLQKLLRTEEEQIVKKYILETINSLEAHSK